MIESDNLESPDYIRIQQNVKEKSSPKYMEEDYVILISNFLYIVPREQRIVTSVLGVLRTSQTLRSLRYQIDRSYQTSVIDVAYGLLR